MGLRMKSFYIMWVHRKIQLFGGCMENQYIGGELSKKRGWIVPDLRGDLVKKKGWCFWGGGGGGLKPQFPLWVRGAFLLTEISKENNIVTQ